MERGVAVAYVRVSSRAQSDAMQRAAIERVAATRGDIISAWYAEARSGRTLDRPELARIRERARRGELRRLYVFRLDRLSRSGIRDTLQVVDELGAAGVELVTIADGFDLQGPAAEVVLAVLAWAAQMERAAIGERIAAARDRIEARGGRWGRPSRLTPAEVTRAQELQADGRSIRSIAMALRCPRSTIARALKEPAPPTSD